MFKLDPLLKKRVNAFTLDLFIVVAMNYFFMAAFTDFLKIVFFHFPITTQLFLVHKFKFVHSISTLSIMFAYFSIFYFTTNGQTMGKMVLGLKVTSKNQELTLKESMIRAASYIGCVWFASLPFLVSFFRKDQKGVACIFSNTKVVLAEEAHKEHQTEFQLSLMDYVAPEIEEAQVTELPITNSNNEEDQDKAA